MDIHIQPDQEAFIRQQIGNGHSETADEVVRKAIFLLEKCEKRLSAKPSLEKKSLAKIFAESPFRGLDLEFPRSKDGLRSFNP